jgi:hypothetical protein
MSEEPTYPKLVSPPPPDAKPAEFDAAAYLKEAMAMRKPLKPAIKKVAVTADVRFGRPHPDVWFQLNPAEDASMDAYLIKDKDNKFIFITEAMHAHPLLYPRIKPAVLIEAAVWPPEVPYVLPFFYPDPERDINAYTTAWRAYEQARDGTWTTMNWGRGGYEVNKATNNPHKPTFSGKPLWELLAIALKGRIIADENHPYVKEQLKGDVG